MKHPTLSIITVTKNRSALLKKNLQSLRGQCKPGDEIIIVDASTDDTRSVIDSFKHMLPIRYLFDNSPGYPSFYNRAVKKARGDIVVFYDDDCVASKTFLSAIRASHQKHPNTIIQGMTESIPRGNMYVDIMADHYRSWLASMTLADGSMRSFDSKNASMPRALFWKLKGLSPVMWRGSEDIELGMRARRSGIRIILDPTICASHHERDTWRAFFRQHRRFAQSEGYLDRILPKHERLGVIPAKKLSGHLISFLRREWMYIRTARVKYALLLPVIYSALVCIRLWGYATLK